MQTALLRRAVVALGLTIAALPVAFAQDYAGIVGQADRTEADRTTDKRRDPVALLTFTAPKTGLTVLDMGAGAGYSTELMARAVGPSGTVYAQNPNESEKLKARMETPAMARVTVLTRPFDDPAPADVRADLITFSRENGQSLVRRAETGRISGRRRPFGEA